MAEQPPIFAGIEPEQQSFPENEWEHQGIAGEQHQENLGVNGSEGQTFGGNGPEDENYAGSEYENQSFAANESEQTFTGADAEQYKLENESEQNFAEDELKQVYDDEQRDQTNEVLETVPPEEIQGRASNAAVEPEKKWPGWPGESVFRMLVPAQKVGNIIGRKGEYIKKIVEETRARIKILDGPPGTAERAVLVAIFKAQIIQQCDSNLLHQRSRLQRSALSIVHAEKLYLDKNRIILYVVPLPRSSALCLEIQCSGRLISCGALSNSMKKLLCHGQH